jgi:hypothetical protein
MVGDRELERMEWSMRLIIAGLLLFGASVIVGHFVSDHMTKAEAMRQGYEQDFRGHWVKAKGGP